MSKRTALAGAAIILLLGLAAVVPAAASLRQVTVGNFYYDDDTPGDGRVDADQGDQLRFVVQDGGPGTPHTVEVDELGVHSGSLAAGETFTTPPLDKPGTYRLYCKPHDQRGHVATLVVRGSSTATTSAPPPTTAAPAPTTPPTTAAPAGGSPTTTAPVGSVTTSPTTATSTSPTPPPPAADGGTLPSDAVTETTLAPVGRGDATAAELERTAPDDSLEVALGRKAARPGPWTRSVRLGLVVLVPMLAAAAFVILRLRVRAGR